MKFYLIVAKGHRQGQPVSIDVDLFLVGSDKICQLRARSLAPKHCAIVVRENKVFIRDMGSGESTLVNGEAMNPSEEWPLHDGDRIAFGNLEFMIQRQEKHLSRKDLEEWAAHCLDVTSEKHLFDEGADEFHEPTNASEAAQAMIEKLTAQKGLVMGRLRIGMESGVTTVRFNDTMLVEDAEIALIRKELCDNLSRNNLRVLVDCKNVKRMSSAGVLMIRDFARWLRPWGSMMALCRVNSDIRPILSILDADKIPLYPDKRSALLAKW